MRTITLVLFATFLSSLIQAQCDRERDSLALVVLYNSTDGPNWTNTWDLAEPMDGWYGITLGGEGCVVCIDLDGDSNCSFEGQSGNGLSGSLPSEITMISELKSLLIDFNNLKGNLPNDLWQLKKLERIQIINNNFEGPLPVGLGNLENIFAVSFGNNSLSGCIPDDYINICSQNINLEGNPALPWSGGFVNFCNGEDQIGAPCDDGRNYTVNDQIQDDCTCIGTSVCEELLHPDYDALMALYASTAGENWTENDGWKEGVEGTSCDPCDWNGGTWYGVSCESGRVSEINIQGNNLEGILPPELGELDSLINLVIISNSLPGPIPIELDSLNKLVGLDLNNNFLTGQIPDFKHLPNLLHLALWNNQITDTIPDFQGLPNLRNLVLRGNNISGNLPDFSSLPNLQNLELYLNNLSGNLPNFNNLSNLQSLLIRSNSFSGPFPEFNNLPNLDYVECFSNNFEGSVPSFELCPLLRVFAASGNNFTGSFPNNFNLASITDLSFADNQLEGCMPFTEEILCSFNFNFINNNLMPWSGDFTNFCNGEEQIGAPCDDGNPTTEFDKINEFCACSGLTCNIEMDSLALKALYQSTDGANWIDPWNLDEDLVNWNGVELHSSGCVRAVTLNNRNLNGTLPAELFNLQLVESLEILNNPELIGSIPNTIKNIPTCSNLKLSGNGLSDLIPPDLDDLCELKVLDLSNNNLSGILPPEISRLENLDTLDFSGNVGLEGIYPSEYQVFCDDMVNFSNTALGAFEGFCLDGTNADECNITLDDFFCIEEIINSLEAIQLDSLNENGFILGDATLGTIDIGPLQYRFLKYEYLDSMMNLFSEEYFLYGCNDFSFEKCTLMGDSIFDCTHDLVQLTDLVNGTTELWSYNENDFIDCVSAISAVQSKDLIELYPNPAFNKVSIDFNGLKIESIHLCDLTGAQLMRSQLVHKKKYTYDISQLVQGLYYFILVSESGVSITRPFVKY